MGTEIGVSRRDIIKRSVAVTGGVLALFKAKSAMAYFCENTIPQGEGPFYPEGDLDRDNDLTVLKPGMAQATGQVIFLSGKVTDDSCAPVAEALLEVWQACYSGKYNHSGDTHKLKLDPNFQYWGRARTNAKGEYLFKTIIPGHYPNGGGTFRPPHIHFKVHAVGFVSLTTQMYFNPDSYEDLEIKNIVAKWNDYENVDDRLKVVFKKVSPFAAEKSGKFDISINRQ